MKTAGFTIIRNAVINDYPVTEAIRSILPLVDEMVVLIGNCDDDTEALIGSIGSPKIRIYHSQWDPEHFIGGKILAVETDKALRLISPDCDWAFYIQADEVIHEKYHPAIREAMIKFKDDQKVEGLLFHYLHFYGTYDYVGDSRKWYNKEIRIVRNIPGIHAYRDAQGFRKNGNKLHVKEIAASVYHYGWVKNPRQMMTKKKNLAGYWQEQNPTEKAKNEPELFDYTQFDSLVHFEGTHPKVMEDRIANQNWSIAIDLSKKQFTLKGALLYWIEKHTGKRLFDYKNYRIIR